MGGQFFSFHWALSTNASDGRLNMRSYLYPSELAWPARPVLEACAFRSPPPPPPPPQHTQLTQFNYFSVGLNLHPGSFQKPSKVDLPHCFTMPASTALILKILWAFW